MEAVTKCEKAANRKFRQHLKNYEALCKEHKGAVRVHRKRNESACTLGDAVYVPDSDVHHLMDTQVMLGISHAIEDLALANGGGGEFISTFQHFDNFLPQKERYLKLAKALDTVRVWGCGEPPEGCDDIDFVFADDPKVRKYWLVLYDSPDCRAMLLCRQVNRAQKFDSKKFVGFYSFNPYLVQSIRWRFNLLSSGLGKVLSHWEKSFQFPAVGPKQLQEVG